jgi:hypothetical protein
MPEIHWLHYAENSHLLNVTRLDRLVAAAQHDHQAFATTHGIKPVTGAKVNIHPCL